MKLLLDTHIALWAIADDPRLSARARELIADPGNDVFVSAASLWEIAIKHALARGEPNDMPLSGLEALRYFREAGYELLAITPADAIAIETLPTMHADPFDRMLVAQALTTPLRLVTHDRKIVGYGGIVIEV